MGCPWLTCPEVERLKARVKELEEKAEMSDTWLMLLKDMDRQHKEAGGIASRDTAAGEAGHEEEQPGNSETANPTE